MSQLGSIFDDESPEAGTKGPDLRVEVALRRSDLESGQPLVLSVPERVPHGEGTVPRHCEVGERPEEVTLHPSPQLADGTVLRLRRQGGEHPSTGIPGDLLIKITMESEPAPAPAVGLSWGVVAMVVVLAAASVAAFAWLG